MELLKKIHAKAKQDGYLTFDCYTDICLYESHLGYYNNKHILAHLNSIVLFDNRNIFVLGNLSSSPPVLAKINFDNCPH